MATNSVASRAVLPAFDFIQALKLAAIFLNPLGEDDPLRFAHVVFPASADHALVYAADRTQTIRVTIPVLYTEINHDADRALYFEAPALQRIIKVMGTGLVKVLDPKEGPQIGLGITDDLATFTDASGLDLNIYRLAERRPPVEMEQVPRLSAILNNFSKPEHAVRGLLSPLALLRLAKAAQLLKAPAVAFMSQSPTERAALHHFAYGPFTCRTYCGVTEEELDGFAGDYPDTILFEQPAEPATPVDQLALVDEPKHVVRLVAASGASGAV